MPPSLPHNHGCDLHFITGAICLHLLRAIGIDYLSFFFTRFILVLFLLIKINDNNN